VREIDGARKDPSHVRIRSELMVRSSTR
jgi:hypothetical protein